MNNNKSTMNNNKFIAPKCILRKSEMSINFKSIKVIGTSFQLIFVHRTLLNVFMDNLRNYYLSRY